MDSCVNAAAAEGNFVSFSSGYGSSDLSWGERDESEELLT